MNMWFLLLTMPCLALSYSMPPLPVQKNVNSNTGGYGTIMGVQGAQVNYELPKSNLPAPDMSYGSIKQPPSQQGVVAVPAPAAKPQPPVSGKPDSTQKAVLPSGSYGSLNAQQVVDQKIEQPVMPPPPAGYGSYMGPIPVTQGALVTKEVQTQAETQAPVPIPSPAPETPKPVSVSEGQSQVLGSYGLPPPVKPKPQSVQPGVDVGTSGGSQTVQVPQPPVVVVPGGSYGSYMSLAMHNKPKAQDQVVPKEKIVAMTTSEPVTDAPETEQPAETAPSSDEQLEENKIAEPAAPAPAPQKCENKSQYCDYWRETGECEKNPAYMKVNCAPACGTQCPQK